MPFLSASYVNFRNLENKTIDLFSREIYFVGENGQGKSNLLESLYLSAYGNSFRTRNDAEIIRDGETEYSVRTMFKEESGKTNSIFVSYSNSKKRIEKNAKLIQDRKEIINTIPCVLFCHDDLSFVTGEPERRRFFIDQSLSMYDALYIDILRKYKKILKSRNTILKEKKTDLLELYDVQLAEAGIEIQKKRRDALFSFNLLFGSIYKEVAGIDNVTLHYAPSWNVKTAVEAEQILQQKREIDLNMGTTMSGPHRDHIRFVKDGRNFIPYASTGQRRLISILLRTSQANFYADKTGRKPVLLMDDVLLELDLEKRQKINLNLPDYDQLFCTFLPGEPYERYKKTTTRVFTLEKGRWHE